MMNILLYELTASPRKKGSSVLYCLLPKTQHDWKQERKNPASVGVMSEKEDMSALLLVFDIAWLADWHLGDLTVLRAQHSLVALPRLRWAQVQYRASPFTSGHPKWFILSAWSSVHMEHTEHSCESGT